MPEIVPNSLKIAKMLANGVLIVHVAFREDCEKIYMGPISADFDQKAWALAQGFEDGGFW